MRTASYVCKTKLIPLTEVANTEKKVPREWINAAHNGVEQPVHRLRPAPDSG